MFVERGKYVCFFSYSKIWRYLMSTTSGVIVFKSWEGRDSRGRKKLHNGRCFYRYMSKLEAVLWRYDSCSITLFTFSSEKKYFPLKKFLMVERRRFACRDKKWEVDWSLSIVEFFKKRILNFSFKIYVHLSIHMVPYPSWIFMIFF